jgi:hypothetical protein
MIENKLSTNPNLHPFDFGIVWQSYGPDRPVPIPHPLDSNKDASFQLIKEMAFPVLLYGIDKARFISDKTVALEPVNLICGAIVGNSGKYGRSNIPDPSPILKRYLESYAGVIGVNSGADVVTFAGHLLRNSIGHIASIKLFDDALIMFPNSEAIYNDLLLDHWHFIQQADLSEKYDDYMLWCFTNHYRWMYRVKRMNMELKKHEAFIFQWAVTSFYLKLSGIPIEDDIYEVIQSIKNERTRNTLLEAVRLHQFNSDIIHLPRGSA